MAEMRKFYAAQEKEVQQANRAIEEQIALQQKLQAQQKYIDQGFSSSASGKAATMEIKGVPQDVINSFLQQADATEKATRAQRQAAAAANYLADAERKLDAQLEDTHDMHARYTDQLVRMKTELSRSGLSADAAAKKFENLRQKVEAVAAKDKQRELAYLSRAISVQMGDVGISLASGMNPLLVMIQQGDQIRGAIQQVGAEGKVLQDAMKTAASQIASSFVLTGKAIGGFFLGSIVSAGQAVGDFAKKIPLIGALPNMFEKAAVNAELSAAILGKNSSLLVGSIRAIGTAAAFSTGLLVTIAGVIAATLPFAIFKAMRQNDELVKSLTLSGGALAVTTSEAYNFALAMEETGVRTSKALVVIAEMGKTGKLGSDSIAMVTRAAVDLEKYGGVAIEETVKVFSDLSKDPVDALIKVAEKTGLVTAENVRLVRQLEEQGRGHEAAALAMETYANVVSGQIERLKSEYTSLGQFFNSFTSSVGDMFDELVDKMRGLFIKATPEQELKKVNDLLENAIIPLEYDRKRLEARRLELSKQVLLAKEISDAEKERTREQQKQIALDKEASKYLSKEEAYYREINRLVKARDEAQSEETKLRFQNQIVKVAKEYAGVEKDIQNVQKSTTEGEKERQKALKGVEAIMKRIREQGNSSIAVQEELNKAEKLRLDILGSETYKNADEATNKRINASL